MPLKRILENTTIKENFIYDSFDEFMNPDKIVIYLKNKKRIEIYKKNSDKKIYLAILKILKDDNIKNINSFLKQFNEKK